MNEPVTTNPQDASKAFLGRKAIVKQCEAREHGDNPGCVCHLIGKEVTLGKEYETPFAGTPNYHLRGRKQRVRLSEINLSPNPMSKADPLRVKLIDLLHRHGTGETDERDGEKIDEMVERIVSERDATQASLATAIREKEAFEEVSQQSQATCEKLMQSNQALREENGRLQSSIEAIAKASDEHYVSEQRKRVEAEVRSAALEGENGRLRRALLPFAELLQGETLADTRVEAALRWVKSAWVQDAKAALG